MGYSKNVFVGAYVEAKNKEIEIDVFEKKCCKTIYKEEDLFCTKCGKPLNSVKVRTESEKSVNHWDVFPKEFEDHLSFVDDEFMDKRYDVDLYVSNYDDKTRIAFGDSDFLEITDDMKTKCVELFLSKFSKEIDILKSKYGESNVSVKFGIIVYYS